jgi:hypothetical protein
LAPVVVPEHTVAPAVGDQGQSSDAPEISLSHAINGNQWQSMAINGNHFQSMAIKDNQG